MESYYLWIKVSRTRGETVAAPRAVGNGPKPLKKNDVSFLSEIASGAQPTRICRPPTWPVCDDKQTAGMPTGPFDSASRGDAVKEVYWLKDKDFNGVRGTGTRMAMRAAGRSRAEALAWIGSTEGHEWLDDGEVLNYFLISLQSNNLPEE